MEVARALLPSGVKAMSRNGFSEAVYKNEVHQDFEISEGEEEGKLTIV